MNVKVKITKLDYLRELSSQVSITKAAERHEREKIKKVKEIGKKLQDTGDLRELRQLLYEIGEDFEWEESTFQWLKKSKPYDFVCINMRMAGLEQKKERYCFWGVMSFSKAPVERFDHLGDLERVVFEKNEKNEFMVLSTILHGVLDLYWEKIGKYEDINEVLKNPNIQFLFEPGDHSIYVDKPKLRIRMLGLTIPDNFFIIRKLLSIQEALMISIPVINHQHLEDILKIDFYEYTKLVVELDTLIHMYWKEKPLSRRIKDFFKTLWAKIRFKKIEKTYLDYLYYLYHVLWRVPINNQIKYLKILSNIFKEAYEKRELLINFEALIEKIINRLEDMVQQTHFLTWQSFSNIKKSAQKIGAERINGLGKLAAESTPVAIEKILSKALDDISYPEKGTWFCRSKRIVFWTAGHTYRILLLVLQRMQNFSNKIRNSIKNFYYKIRRKEIKEEETNKK